MTNAWSLLSEIMYGPDDEIEYIRQNGGFEYTPPVNTGNVDLNFNEIDLNLESTSKNGFWKYEEDLTMKEVRDYLSGTYKSHYTSQESKTQTLDLIDNGDETFLSLQCN